MPGTKISKITRLPSIKGLSNDSFQFGGSKTININNKGIIQSVTANSNTYVIGGSTTAITSGLGSKTQVQNFTVQTDSLDEFDVDNHKFVASSTQKYYVYITSEWVDTGASASEGRRYIGFEKSPGGSPYGYYGDSSYNSRNITYNYTIDLDKDDEITIYAKHDVASITDSTVQNVTVTISKALIQ